MQGRPRALPPPPTLWPLLWVRVPLSFSVRPPTCGPLVSVYWIFGITNFHWQAWLYLPGLVLLFHVKRVFPCSKMDLIICKTMILGPFYLEKLVLIYQTEWWYEGKKSQEELRVFGFWSFSLSEIRSDINGNYKVLPETISHWLFIIKMA